ncbi:MAG TPA: ABC transporter substrate-binding protein [Acidimicrobiia bacterium]|nr:ABC transporter substrate-binding protein [Acidimicrobiia bacterium]
MKELQSLDSELEPIVDAYQRKLITRREFMRKALATGLTLSAASAVLAACAQGTSTTTAAAGASTTAAGAPVQGGTLREGYNRDVSKHDPLTTNWYDPAFFAIYETILTDDPEGETAAQIADTFEASDDGLTYTFNIPSGTKFHSGADLDATTMAEFYKTLQSTSFIAGLAAPVDTYEAPDANTLVIRMKNPWIGVLGPHKTGYWALSNIQAWNDAGGAESTTYGTEIADGTGPFTHEEWVPGSHVLVNKWADYPGSRTPFFENKGPAYLDAIRWTVITEAAQRATQLENGDIDTVIGPAHTDVARLEGNPDLTVYKFPEWSGYMLSMNHDYPEFFGDKETRQGLSHALDREAMVAAILSGNGAATYGPFPTTDRNYDPAVEALNNYDVARANELLDEAGWVVGADGIRERDGTKFSFELMVEAESTQEAVASAVSAAFSEVGVDAQVNVVDRAVAFERQSAPGRDSVPMSLFFWLWPIPIDVLTLFAGSAFIPVPNFSHAVVPRIDTAIENWQNSATAEDAQAAASEFQMAWAEELPFLSLMNQNATFVKNNRVHGWSPYVWNLYPFYNDVWIEA